MQMFSSCGTPKESILLPMYVASPGEAEHQITVFASSIKTLSKTVCEAPSNKFHHC